MTTTELAERLGWGRLLAGQMFGYPGGMKAIERRAMAAIGSNMNRTSLREVLALTEAPTSGIVAFRAWVILTALGQDPETWGVPNDVVPPAHDHARLVELLYAPGDSNPEPSDVVSDMQRAA